MCIYLFSQNKELHLDFVAESITLMNGGIVVIMDALVTNHSSDPVDRIHIACPHDIPADSKKKGNNPYFEDITETWIDRSNEHNYIYQSPGAGLYISNGIGKYEIKVEIPNPSNITETRPYNGNIYGIQKIVPFEIEDDNRVNSIQWEQLSKLGWSIFTIKFKNPIILNDARWLRFKYRTAILNRNHKNPIENFIKKYTGLLEHSFEIAGPLDIKHRLISSIKAAEVTKNGSKEKSYSKLRIKDLQDKLITKALERTDTKVIIKDWRINVFTSRYRKVYQPIYWGDIEPCGGLKNPIPMTDGTTVTCLQWKAGELNVKEQKHNGSFVIRLNALDQPIIVGIVPWLSLAIALTMLINKIFF